MKRDTSLRGAINLALRSGSGAIALSIATGMLATSQVHAQSAPATAGGDSQVLSEVVVTGSRIQRDGFEAPTPTSVLTAAEIQSAAPINIADFVNQMPAMTASRTPRQGNNGGSSPYVGINSMDLRGLGLSRTLVLLDGQRVVPSTILGNVDVNNLPTALVDRVDIVTGGASAAYGSDAVAGVVNYVINKKFTGLKTSATGGTTTLWDGETFNADLSFGTPFAGGRGHVLASVDYGYSEGIDWLDPSKRKWWKSCNMLQLGANATPQRIVACGVNTSRIAQGGVITNTALAFTQFGQGGVPMPFELGSPANTTFMVGGNQWSEQPYVALDANVERLSLWSRVSYNLTDNVEASFDASYGVSDVRSTAGWQRYPGVGSTALLMRVENPFLPASIAQQARDLGITTFNYGYATWDIGRPYAEGDRQTSRAVATLNGSLANNWQWTAYYQWGRTKTDYAFRNTTINANFALAIDAVRHPDTNEIVCRSTLTNPSNGCVPLNVFGWDVASPEAIDYVKGESLQEMTFTQNVAAASITGDLFDNWAGPVSVATGAEYREEKVTGWADPLSVANAFFTGNYKPTFGKYDAKELFVETVVPLARDVPLARTLDFNAAARYTDYSYSGDVTTWKVGLSYEPIDQLRLRAVLSRDIRAPNMSELFVAGATQGQDVVDTSLPNRPLVRHTRVTQGNLDLVPEEADTTSFGVVYRPSWLPQLSASVDYYSIDIAGAIGVVTSQQTVDRCVAGETVFCGLIIRDTSGNIAQIMGVPININEQTVRGIDYELSFNQNIGPGQLRIRALATNVLDFYTINNNVKDDALGEVASRKWRWRLNASYFWSQLSLTATIRGFNDGVYDNDWRSGVEIDNNKVKGTNYFDLAGTYRFMDGGDGGILTGFFKVENLFDRDPELFAASTIAPLHTNTQLYDAIGRSIRVGVRYEF